MRGCEIKELRWRDVDMFGHSLAMKKSKTEAGEHVFPLNLDAWEVILALYRRSGASSLATSSSLPVRTKISIPRGL